MGTFHSEMDDREIHYDCRKGYQLIGSRNIECASIEDQYEWGSQLPTCVRFRGIYIIYICMYCINNMTFNVKICQIAIVDFHLNNHEIHRLCT